MFKKFILPSLVFYFYWIWAATWRLKIHESKEFSKAVKDQSPLLIAMWHGDELALIRVAFFYKVATLTSTSKDGELINSVLKKVGFETTRGSSTRGGAGALKGLLRLAKKGYITVVPVDGPKGPYHLPKPGILGMSYLLKCPIIPAGVVCSSSLKFQKTWNKTYLPWPFAKVFVVFDSPFEPIVNSEDIRSPLAIEKLKKAIDDAGQKAAILMAHKT